MRRTVSAMSAPSRSASSRYRRPQAIRPSRMPMIVTPRSSKGVPSSLVPRQIHSPPLRVAHHSETEELRSKVGDAVVQLRPVLPHLLAPGEGSGGMHRLLASVVLTEAGNVRLEVMGVHGLPEPLAGAFAAVLLDSAHLVPPVRLDAPSAPALGCPGRLILPSGEAHSHRQTSLGAWTIQAYVPRAVPCRWGPVWRQPAGTRAPRVPLGDGRQRVVRTWRVDPGPAPYASLLLRLACNSSSSLSALAAATTFPFCLKSWAASVAACMASAARPPN
jgi:hypothetical protein